MLELVRFDVFDVDLPIEWLVVDVDQLDEVRVAKLQVESKEAAVIFVRLIQAAEQLAHDLGLWLILCCIHMAAVLEQ